MATSDTRLLIIGASARAAAFSALRAGLHPWCADLFADADLRARCHVTRLPATDYPHGFADVLAKAPPGPWLYTGGLENRPALVQMIAQRRELWGNNADSLKAVRSPALIYRLLTDAGLLCPAIHKHYSDVPKHGRWLVKPLAGTGGAGITQFGKSAAKRKQVYFQEFIEGTPHSAVFLSTGQEVFLLGITEQLVGEEWLHAAEFRYCGSVGPLFITPGIHAILSEIGEVLATGCSLRGLFGVDYIHRYHDIFPVEVNPRYTASVEILENVADFAAIAYHRRVFDPCAPRAKLLKFDFDAVAGKAILFARDHLTFPAEGPWIDVVKAKRSVKELPLFADIPDAGERIEKGRPILTIFARADSEDECREQLRQTAADLDRRLFGR